MATTSKSFKELSKDKQNKLRLKYKKEHHDEYRTSIIIFILQIVFGILAISGLFLIKLDAFLGLLVFTMNFICILIALYYLYKSNKPFKDFLESQGYKK